MSEGTPVFSAPEASEPKRKSGTNLRMAMALTAVAIGVMFVAAGMRSCGKKPQPLSNVEPSVAALAAKASAETPVAAASAAVAAAAPVINLPKPAPQAVAATIPAAADAAVDMDTDMRFARLEERFSAVLRELNNSRADVRALEQRVARLEGELKQANERVQELTEKSAKADEAKNVAKAIAEKKPAETPPPAEAARNDAAPASRQTAQAQARKVAAVKRRKTNRFPKATAGGSAAAAVAGVNGSSRQKRAPKGQGALLAVDMWDGKPSAVIGTGIPGDRRVRVLQPGEQLAGVALVKADARRGSATFSTGTGVFTMFVDE